MKDLAGYRKQGQVVAAEEAVMICLFCAYSYYLDVLTSINTLGGPIRILGFIDFLVEQLVQAEPRVLINISERMAQLFYSIGKKRFGGDLSQRVRNVRRRARRRAAPDYFLELERFCNRLLAPVEMDFNNALHAAAVLGYFGPYASWRHARLRPAAKGTIDFLVCNNPTPERVVRHCSASQQIHCYKVRSLVKATYIFLENDSLHEVGVQDPARCLRATEMLLEDTRVLLVLNLIQKAFQEQRMGKMEGSTSKLMGFDMAVMFQANGQCSILNGRSAQLSFTRLLKTPALTAAVSAHLGFQNVNNVMTEREMVVEINSLEREIERLQPRTAQGYLRRALINFRLNIHELQGLQPRIDLYPNEFSQIYRALAQVTSLLLSDPECLQPSAEGMRTHG
jgi:hypothetical protein